MRKLLILLLILSGSISYGRTFYLSPSGNDSNPGTSGQPFFTLNKAWTVILPGDTVYLFGGVYKYESTQNLKGKNGSATNKIKIWAFPGETPVITRNFNCEFKYYWTSGIWFTGDYFHWKGIEITGFTQQDSRVYTGFRISDSSNNIFELINSHHNGHGCEITGKSTNNLVLNSDFHNNQDPLTSPPFENADGLEICYIPAGLTNKVKGCRFWNNSDDGIDLWQNDGMVKIDSCWSWNNGYIPGTDTPAGNGNGFKLGVTTLNLGTKVLRTIRNSLAYNNRTRGFDQNKALCSMELFNNTAYQNGTNGFVFDYGNIIASVKNCISYKNVRAPAFNSSSVQGGNAFSDYEKSTSATSISDGDFMSVEVSQLVCPRKPDGSLPEITFMHPAPDSWLIDKGVDAGIPYSGRSPDIGAFEVASGEFRLNRLPEVSISFPMKGTSFTPPATVTVNVEAIDPDGSISKVELFTGSKKLGENSEAPFIFTLKELPAGTYNLRAVATDNLKASVTSETLHFVVVANNDKGEYFNLYPNPNNGCFSVDFSSLLVTETYTLTIVDLIGNPVYREEITADDTTRQFDLSHLNSGIYILMISANQIILTQKLIKR